MSYINRKKNSSWKKHVLKNLIVDLILYEKIETNASNIKNLANLLSKLINWAKKDNLHSRRMACRYIEKKQKETIKKLFSELKERYKKREGGYSRANKLKLRKGDGSLRIIFSLVK